MKIFDHLTNLTAKKITPDFQLDEVKKSYDIYMINRFVSTFEHWIPIVELMNHYSIPKEAHYQFMLNILPKMNVSFTGYISTKKKNVDEERRQILIKHFDFGSRDLDCALSILTDEQIEEICKKYQYGKTK